MKITEHSREGSDWVDDIQGRPRGELAGLGELVKMSAATLLNKA